MDIQDNIKECGCDFQVAYIDAAVNMIGYSSLIMNSLRDLRRITKR